MNSYSESHDFSRDDFNGKEAHPMSDAEFFGSLTLIIAALIVLRIFFA